MEYIQGVSTQTRLFGWSLVLGIALGLVYCVFRFIRYLFGNGRGICLVADILYFFVYGVSVLFFNLVADEGRLRIYTIFGAALGTAVVYLVTAHVSIRLCNLCVKVFRVIILLLLAPIKFLIRKIKSLIKKISQKYQKRIKKT